MPPSSVNGRLQGTLNQPHGIPQLDQDRKIEPDQLRINEADGISGLDAAVEIPMPLLKTDVANGLAGLDAAVEIPMSLLKTDVANGLAGLDASKRIINDVPVSLLADMQNQSFTNLLKNGDFESWSAGAAAAPDGWTFSGCGSIARENAIVKINTYSSKLMGGSALQTLSFPIAFLRQDVTYTIGAWIKITGRTTGDIVVDEYGAGSAVNTTGTILTSDQDWTWHAHDINLPTVPGNLRLRLYSTANTGCSVYIDGTILVEGSVCPAFSPHPTDQIPIVLTSAPTDAGINGETRWYAMAGAGGARRLYMSNGTDWKYIAIST